MEGVRSALDWSAAVSLSTSDGGSGGVFFFDWSDGTRVVLKGTGEPARELFAQKVLSLCGASAPLCRVVSAAGPTEDEWVGARKAAERLAEGDADLLVTVRKSLNRAHLLVQEFVRGRPLLQVPPDGEEWHDEGLWEKIGVVVAVDVLLNNLDRVRGHTRFSTRCALTPLFACSFLCCGRTTGI